MLTRQKIRVKDREVEAVCLELGRANLIVAAAPKGYVMCGYLDMQTAEQLGDAAAVVRGISTIPEMLERPVAAVSKKAAELGVKCGMSGQQALELMV